MAEEETWAKHDDEAMTRELTHWSDRASSMSSLQKQENYGQQLFDASYGDLFDLFFGIIAYVIQYVSPICSVN